MEIKISNTKTNTSDIINETGLFKSIQNFSENNVHISKSLVGNKFSLMSKSNESNIEKIERLIETINNKIHEHEDKKEVLLTEIEYNIAKIKKQLI